MGTASIASTPRYRAPRTLPPRGRLYSAEGVPSAVTAGERACLAAYRDLSADGTPSLADVAATAGLSHAAASKCLYRLRRMGVEIPRLLSPQDEVAATPGEVNGRKFAIRNAKLAGLGHREPTDDDDGPPTLRAICRGYVREHRAMLRRWGWIEAPKREGRAA